MYSIVYTKKATYKKYQVGEIGEQGKGFDRADPGKSISDTAAV